MQCKARCAAQTGGLCKRRNGTMRPFCSKPVGSPAHSPSAVLRLPAVAPLRRVAALAGRAPASALVLLHRRAACCPKPLLCPCSQPVGGAARYPTQFITTSNNMDQLIQQFRVRLAESTVNKQPLRIRGGGTKDWYGQSLNGEVLDTRAHAGIVSYDPTELVITARAGTLLSDIEATLAKNNQMLAFEPPHYGLDSTIGGVVASGLSGPRRAAVGAVRDFVLGAVMLDGRGEVHHFGGQVMKNVAGYDVSRLLAGALGTLGLILDVSLKVLPRPLHETTLGFEMGKTEVIRQLNLWGRMPLPISASAWHGGVLLVRLSGSEPAVKAAMQKMGGEERSNEANTWRDLRNQSNAYFTQHNDVQLWRLSVPSTLPPLNLDGDHLIEWGGAQRWLKTTLGAATIRSVVASVGGHATLYRGGDKSVGVFQPLKPAVSAIHRNLKAAFDPAGIFNPGRMYNEF